MSMSRLNILLESKITFKRLDPSVQEVIRDLADDSEFQGDYNLTDNIDDNIKYILSDKKLLRKYIQQLVDDLTFDIKEVKGTLPPKAVKDLEDTLKQYQKFKKTL